MYKKISNLVLGFHGCHRKTFQSVIMEGGSLKKSANSYDWLGNGIYFWEQNINVHWNGRFTGMGKMKGLLLAL